MSAILLLAASHGSTALARLPGKEPAPAPKSSAPRPGTAHHETPRADLQRMLSQLYLPRPSHGSKTVAEEFEKERQFHEPGPGMRDSALSWAARYGAKRFQPTGDANAVILMFHDGSGAYVHEDGFITPMGDVRAEVAQWEELP
jgi:hypothetical protein